MTLAAPGPPADERRLDVVVLDVNETLSDLEGLRPRFREVGASEHLLELWFASTLRDGIGLTAAGGTATFSDVATEVLAGLLAGAEGLRGSPVEAAQHVIDGFGELEVHPDVPGGMRVLHAAGLRLATLTNGSAEVSEKVLEGAGMLGLVERRLSVEDVGPWKPAPEPYAYAGRELGVAPDRMALIAVHPWDIDGAKRAGLVGAWLNRTGVPYPRYLSAPDVTGGTLTALAEALLELRG